MPWWAIMLIVLGGMMMIGFMVGMVGVFIDENMPDDEPADPVFEEYVDEYSAEQDVTIEWKEEQQ